MKSVPKNERIFLERVYRPKFDISFLKQFELIVVDDLIFTGTSIYSFIRSLQREGLKIETVACLFGNPNLTPDPQNLDTLSTILFENKLDIRKDILSNVLVN